MLLLFLLKSHGGRDLVACRPTASSGRQGTQRLRDQADVGCAVQVLAALSVRGVVGGNSHVPFRDSRLTQLLWEGLR